MSDGNIHKPAGGFFTSSLSGSDPEITAAIRSELGRQRDQIELIASENMVSKAVLAAQGSILTNKYAEGYPERRYYGGCEHVDKVEKYACERAQKLFDCAHVNVQPHSGSQANQAVFMALLKPGQAILGMSLDAGGHLTHGAAPNQSGKWFRAAHYGVRREDCLIDMEQVEQMANELRPDLIIAGGSAYSRIIDFAAFRRIADKVGARLMVDMSHFAGLVAAGLYPSPLPHADCVTTTTHKTLRGPRGGMVLTNDLALGKKVDSAIFPGLQGGPLMHVIAAKAVAFNEALDPAFKAYAAAVIANAKAMTQTMLDHELDIVSGGTDSHLALVDLRRHKVSGKAVEAALERAAITCNKNAIPFDPEKPTITSGIRVGSPAGTTRGFGVDEFSQIGKWIANIVKDLAANGDAGSAVTAVREEVRQLCDEFPVYPCL